MAVTAADLAAFTGRDASDANVVEAATVAPVVLDQWWVTEDADSATVDLATKHVGRWLLQARQGDLVDGGDLGTIYLPSRLPAVNKMLDRKEPFA